jgi:hypothetical protein
MSLAYEPYEPDQTTNTSEYADKMTRSCGQARKGLKEAEPAATK